MADDQTIILTETIALIRESALAKDVILKQENINNALVQFIGSYDLYVVFWAEDDAECRLVVRWPGVDGCDLRGNAALIEDRQTAIALHAACLAEDNFAPLPDWLSEGAPKPH
ncbi:hypothetical protein H8A99_13310 [Bradyrhizobium sp. Arg68]|uniref:hypothetical protein n=1 Tax=Bradyrhizobium ivorense TaxID=2511166 RepID=UPI001E39CCC4|nr:hypothetical protein [Bradyrhizobium ivorense]MCC8937424.1 hypothetical protein [Bradyrhizobium ivorense]